MDRHTFFLRLTKLAVVALVLIAPEFGGAQAQPPAQVETGSASSTGSSKPLVFNGELGTFGEVYSISGIAARRPSSTGRIYLRSTLTGWGSITAGFNVMLSTEGNSARQEINQLDFNPKWRWGQAHVGDFTEDFTPLTLGGVQVRGGGVLVSPGAINIALISGMTKRSVSTSDNNRSYERHLTGGRLGIGHSGGTGFDLYFVTARDELSSLASVRDTVTAVDTSLVDTSLTEIEQNPVSITPQENLVLSAVTNLALLQRKLRWRTEIGASALTRDRRSAEPESSDVPDALKSIFTPRVSSQADYAYTTDLSMDISKVTVSAGFHYIGPGYVSLGLASLIADKREVTAGVLARHRGGMVKVDGAIQNDNLIDQKSHTTQRSRLSALVSHRLRPRWNATLGIIYTGVDNDAGDVARKVNFSSWVLRTGHYLSFNRDRGLRSLSLDYTYQTSGDQNPLRQSSDLKAHSASLNGTLALRRNLESVLTAGLVNTRIGVRKAVLTQTYSAAARHLAIGGKLTSSATVNVAVGEVNTTIRPSLKFAYVVGADLTLTAEMESTHNRGGAEASRFNEYAGRLLLSRRF